MLVSGPGHAPAACPRTPQPAPSTNIFKYKDGKVQNHNRLYHLSRRLMCIWYKSMPKLVLRVFRFIFFVCLHSRGSSTGLVGVVL